MPGENARPEVVSQLEAALEADGEQKDFHVRQALQLLEVEEGGDWERNDGAEGKNGEERGGEERDGAERDGAES